MYTEINQPCGFYSDSTKECTCSNQVITRYQKRISGPLLDRIDIRVAVLRPTMDELESMADGESSAVVSERVGAARLVQAERFASTGGAATNAGAAIGDLRELGTFSEGALSALRSAATRMALSARAYHRAMRVARTVADLDGESAVERRHAIEALAYRDDAGNGAGEGHR